MATVAFTLLAGCESVDEFSVRVLLPEDQNGLSDVDNLTLALEPGGELTQQAIDGLDFSVELELPPNTLVRANLYLAKGNELRAWGRSSWFFDKSTPGVAIFAGRPGALSTFPGLLDQPDPQLLAAYLPGRGLLMLEATGDSFLLDEYDLQVKPGPSLTDAPDPTLGGLFSLEDAALRITWGAEPRASRLDAETGTWAELLVELPDALEVAALAPVASNHSATRGHLFIYGETRVWHIDLLDAGAADEAAITSSPGVEHDGPRPGATALSLSASDAADMDLVFGSDDARPVFWTAETGAFGPPGPWIGGRCVQANEEETPLRVLCGGGVRGGVPSPDLLVLEIDEAGQLQAQSAPDPLPSALVDPLWLRDEAALYAQGEGQLLRIARDSLVPDNIVSTAQRFTSGHSVALPTGATFLVGGLGNEGQPLDRWQVFTPDIPSIEP